MSSNLTMTDLFCGAGGSSTGAVQVPGVEVRLAANHWDRAIETHNANHPDTDHLQADISQTDPRYVATTDMLWASPECTNHSKAKGRVAGLRQPDLFGETLPDEAAERSRATMWDVVRFTEVHDYKAVLVENVVEVVQWSHPRGEVGSQFRNWTGAMANMGYEYKLISLNSMHAQAHGLPAPQSRDRVYIAFWRKGERAPDFEHMQRPRAFCPTCGEVVASVQSFKNPNTRVGKYRSQYVYRCPKHSCRGQIVEPAWLPAASFIDWSNPGTRIGDRDKPLAEKTMRRIQAGIERYWTPLTVEHGGNGYDAADPKHPSFGDPDGYYRAWPTSEVVKTLHARESKGVAYLPTMIPVEGRDGKRPSTSADVLRTQSTRNETGVAFPTLMVPAGGTWNDDAWPSDRAARARTTREAEGLAFPPFISEMRGGGSVGHPASDPVSTVSAGGNHHALIMSYYSRDDAVRRASEPIATVTTEPRHGVMTNQTVNIADVRFRMLEPSEIKQAMAFPVDYIMTGTRREQVKLSGNAVTPPAARDLIATVSAAITGEAA